MPELSLLLSGLATTLAVMAVAWLISIPLRDVSIVDIFWSINIAAAGFVYMLGEAAWSGWPLAVLLLTLAWAARLALHIGVRNHGGPEDRRYRAMREKRDPGFWWKSAFIVFALQALLAFIVSLPLAGIASGQKWNAPLAIAGFSIGVFGLVFESVADYQLSRFLSGPRAEGAVMDKGLWRYSRHPNYFGEFCLWWGVFLIAGAAGAWWSVIGPLVLSFFLLRVSGVSLTEKDIAERRPAYRDYVRRTSVFVPLPPSNP